MTDRDSTIDGEQIEQLTRTVTELSEETRVLRMAIDELRDDVVHVLRNVDHDGLPCWRPITSMPIDPLADNFGEQINSFTPEQVEARCEDVAASTGETSDEAPTSQQELF